MNECAMIGGTERKAMGRWSWALVKLALLALAVIINLVGFGATDAEGIRMLAWSGWASMFHPNMPLSIRAAGDALLVEALLAAIIGADVMRESMERLQGRLRSGHAYEVGGMRFVTMDGKDMIWLGSLLTAAEAQMQGYRMITRFLVLPGMDVGPFFTPAVYPFLNGVVVTLLHVSAGLLIACHWRFCR